MRAPRPMPTTRLEALLGRHGAVVALWLSAALAVALSALLWGAALERPLASSLASMVPILVSIPIVCWAFVVFQLVTTRVRRTGPAQISAARDALPHGILIPGRRGHTLALLAAVGTAAAFCVIATVTTSGGWAIAWGSCAALCVIATVSTGIAAAHPRRLILHPNGLGSASFLSDAAVQWHDIETIEFTEGAAGMMVLRVHVAPTATSFESVWRHPFFRRKKSLDVEPLSLGIDGTLLWLALRLYATDPAARQELASGRTPARLFDPVTATAVPFAVAHPVIDVFRPSPRS
ncbi:hypothetical protein [Microbacterium sp. Leaf159]|uniref:hypothetical protein n=1 Tax=Microbacterium sp. Leaf159 TaxID=1736279 RepID=UPI0012F825D4|nr:hypothetical protein [Microbacterium sp. Leaf159]